MLVCLTNDYECESVDPMQPFRSISLAILSTAVALSATSADPPMPDQTGDKARNILQAWLGKTMANMNPRIEPKVIPITHEAIGLVFPTDHFFGVYLPRWPRAVIPPEPLSLETVVCVTESGAVEPIGSYDKLREFLVHKVAGVTDEKKAGAATMASLLLAAFGAKGAPYQLGNPDIAVVNQGDRLISNGTVSVTESGRGNIKVTLAFEPDGRISPNDIKINSSTRPGPPGSG